MNVDGSFGSFDYNVNGFQDSSNYDYSAMVDSNPSNNYDYNFSPTNLDGYDGLADYEAFVDSDAAGKGYESITELDTSTPDRMDVMRFWSFMHSNWNQYQASRLEHLRGTNPLQPRFYQYHGADDKFVTNNLRAGGRDLLAGRFDLESANYPLEGQAGKTLFEMMEDGQLGSDTTTFDNMYDKPWELTQEQDFIVNSGQSDTTTHPMGSQYQDTAVLAGSTHDFPFLFDMDLKDFDSSWELGYPQSVASKEQSLQRWFEGQNRADGVNQFNAANASVEKDDARLRCKSCEVQMKLEWVRNSNGIGGHFVTRHTPSQISDSNQKTVTGSDSNQDLDAWARCADSDEEIACEFSSGVCFVEERRTWGYVTYVKKGCKQAQACYMQKYQNFLVEAGRQCWPEDNSNMNRRIAARPHDLKADEWIYNIIAGGGIDHLTTPDTILDSWASNDWSHADDGSVMQWAHAVYANRQFDNTFTDLGPYANPDVSDTILQDDSNGLTEGLLIILSHLPLYLLIVLNSIFLDPID